jgi:cytochrome c
MICKPTAMALLVLASGVAVAADPVQDAAMLKLAGDAGCMTCHQVEPGGKGPGGLAPIGPAWRDVSAKYLGNKDAVTQLTTIVQAGSNPYESHWKGKVSGLAMPPNKVVIGEADTKKLVSWILSLDPPKR